MPYYRLTFEHAPFDETTVHALNPVDAELAVYASFARNFHSAAYLENLDFGNVTSCEELPPESDILREQMPF